MATRHSCGRLRLRLVFLRRNIFSVLQHIVGLWRRCEPFRSRRRFICRWNVRNGVRFIRQLRRRRRGSGFIRRQFAFRRRAAENLGNELLDVDVRTEVAETRHCIGIGEIPRVIRRSNVVANGGIGRPGAPERRKLKRLRHAGLQKITDIGIGADRVERWKFGQVEFRRTRRAGRCPAGAEPTMTANRTSGMPIE